MRRGSVLALALCLLASCAEAQPGAPSNLGVTGSPVMSVTVATRGSNSTTTPSSPTTFANIVNLPDTTGISIVGVIYGDGTTTDVSGVTLGGATVTKLTARDSNDSAVGGVWLGKVLHSDIGSTGNKDLVVTHGTMSTLIAGVVCLADQHATTPLGTPVTAIKIGTPVTVDVTDSVAGDMIVDVVANGSPIASTTQTQEWLRNVDGHSGAGNGAQSSAAGASGTVTMSWTVTSDIAAIAAVTVKQAAGGAAVTPAGQFHERLIARGIARGVWRH